MPPFLERRKPQAIASISPRFANAFPLAKPCRQRFSTAGNERQVCKFWTALARPRCSTCSSPAGLANANQEAAAFQCLAMTQRLLMTRAPSPLWAKSATFGCAAPARSRSIGAFLNLPLARNRSEEHTSELQSQSNLVCRLLLEKKKKQ